MEDFLCRWILCSKQSLDFQNQQTFSTLETEALFRAPEVPASEKMGVDRERLMVPPQGSRFMAPRPARRGSGKSYELAGLRILAWCCCNVGHVH